MATKEINESLIEIDGKVRAELGFRRVEGVADEATLSDDFTAVHYKATPIDPKTKKPFRNEAGRPIINRDALGNMIEAGKPFTYLDYREKHGPRVWYIYKLTEINDPEDTRDDVWSEVAVVDGDKDAALAEAKKHLKD